MATTVVVSAPICFVFRWPFVPTQEALSDAAGSRLDLTPQGEPISTELKDPIVTAVWATSTPVATSSEETFFDCFGDCAMDILGIKDIIALAGVGAGLPLKPKPNKPGALGAGSRTSPLSAWLSEKLPQRLPRQIPTPTNIFTRAGRRAATPVLGRVIGRLIPGLGWVMLGIDLARIMVCTARCMEGNATS